MSLEPYPQALLDGLLERMPEPLARHDARQAIRLAFVAALQALPAGERCMLVLCDVAGFPPAEAAGRLGLDPLIAARALLRGRSTLAARLAYRHAAPPPAGSPTELALLAGFADAFEAAAVGGLFALPPGERALGAP